MQNYVSSIDNKLKQSKLNNVILSLDCLVSCSTNDKTEQNYGVIEYSGPISPGQVIKGSKKPMKSGTPVIADNIFLGVINNDGDLTVSKTDTDTINAHCRREDRFTTNCVVRVAVSALRKT